MEVESRLSKRSHKVHWSGIRVMFDLAGNIPGVINLGLGEPDFDTPKHIRESAKKALDEGYTRYPPSAGFRDLREAVAFKLKRENNITADPYSEIFISVGAMQGIFNTILHLVNPGDEVIVIDPGYDYYAQIKLFDGIPIQVPAYEQNHFKVDPDDIEKAVTHKTKLMILNTPSNPTGAILDQEILGQISKIGQRNGILVLSDEPYEKIIFDGKKHLSIASLEGMKSSTISVFTFSKTYAMPGWRVGYVVADKCIIAEMEKTMEHMTSGVTTVSQRAALASIQGHQDDAEEMVKEYEKRRNILCEGLNKIEGITCSMPEGAFYAFPNISSFSMTSWDFAKFLLDVSKVATIPGSIFGNRGEGFLRISFAANIALLQEAISRIEEGIRLLQKK